MSTHTDVFHPQGVVPGNPFPDANTVTCPVPSCLGVVGTRCSIADAPHVRRIEVWRAARDGYDQGYLAAKARVAAALDQLAENLDIKQPAQVA